MESSVITELGRRCGTPATLRSVTSSAPAVIGFYKLRTRRLRYWNATRFR